MRTWSSSSRILGVSEFSKSSCNWFSLCFTRMISSCFSASISSVTCFRRSTSSLLAAASSLACCSCCDMREIFAASSASLAAFSSFKCFSELSYSSNSWYKRFTASLLRCASSPSSSSKGLVSLSSKSLRSPTPSALLLTWPLMPLPAALAMSSLSSSSMQDKRLPPAPFCIGAALRRRIATCGLFIVPTTSTFARSAASSSSFCLAMFIISMRSSCMSLVILTLWSRCSFNFSSNWRCSSNSSHGVLFFMPSSISLRSNSLVAAFSSDWRTLTSAS
mmetsp:Transcript_11564/g.32911  ORF Transcript_11564/g.32911 Transcript_11564/m.32911 type:complete len:277 (-) Transcript_11564:739-1569(-)